MLIKEQPEAAPQAKLADRLVADQFVVVCQNIRSLFNVGSIFRTADCFGVDKIYLTGITGRPPRKEISKVALGADTYIPWEYAKQPLRTVRMLKKAGFTIVALEQATGAAALAKRVDINAFEPKLPIALLLGYEVKGLPKSLLAEAHTIVEIPQYGKKESLNVSVAFGIAANHIARNIEGSIQNNKKNSKKK
jgi:23S rRNA (guanosine2251-2'-O)-methyltransferase